MTAALGINIDGIGAAIPRAVKDVGAAWVRLVLLPDRDTRHLVSLYQSAGLKVLGVIARESVEPFGPHDRHSSWEHAATEYRKRVGTILDCIQVGNESDHESPSSWTLAAWEINDLARAFHGFKMRIGPGLVSGHPEYVDGLDLSLFDAIAVHPYGRGPVPHWPHVPNFGYVGDLLDRYAAYGKRLWVTEWGYQADPGQGWVQAKYVAEMSRTLRDHPAVDVAMLFCWSDRSGVAPFGLLDRNDRPKAAYQEFYEATHEEEEEPAMPEFHFGFKDYAEAHRVEVGKPLSSEVYFSVEEGKKVSCQLAEGGLLVYAGESNAVRFLPAGKL